MTDPMKQWWVDVTWEKKKTRYAIDAPTPLLAVLYMSVKWRFDYQDDWPTDISIEEVSK